MVGIVGTTATAKIVEEVFSERKRQVDQEGFTAEKDDNWQQGELASAAAAYALAGVTKEVANGVWPWVKNWFKDGDNRRNLVKAASLILAEIERIDRGR